jgi:zinc protease
VLLRSIPLASASEEGIARGLIARAVDGLPLDEPTRAASRYLSLSAEDVRAAFARWIRPGDLVQVVEGPPPR